MRKNTNSDFWAKVDKTSSPEGCWLWVGYTAPNGPRFIQRGKIIGAHRHAAILSGVDVPYDGRIAHTCGNKICVNPAHMEFGTRLTKADGRARAYEKMKSKARVTDSGCIEYTGYKTDFGYGLINVHGKTTVAHRFAWEMTYGAIPQGCALLHSCDNPSCINPEHLKIGNQAENVKEMDSRGRRRYGKNKLTKEQVLTIRTTQESTRSLAVRFGVTHYAIACVKKGRTYKKLLSHW